MLQAGRLGMAVVKLKRWLFFLHRWLGVGMCLLFIMWPLSGVVMMYVGFPELTENERLAGLPPLDAGQIGAGPSRLWQLASAEAPIEEFRLSSVAARPAYLLKQAGRPWLGLYADTGEWLEEPKAEDAENAARVFYQAQQDDGESIGVSHRGTLETDQWTVSSALHPHRPLHKVALRDEAATWLYVSSSTGQVVRDVTRNERMWNWLGANLHWIYPVQLRKHDSLWRNLLIAISLVGLASVLSGLIIGLMRLRIRRRHREQRASPYRGVMKLHHIGGLASVVFLTTFMFSGFMSMTPWSLFDAKTSFVQQLWRYQRGDDGGSHPVYSTAEEIRQLLRQHEADGIKELNWHWFAGQSSLALHDAPNASRVLWPPRGENPLASVNESQQTEQIEMAISRLLPSSEVSSIALLERYDNYYYSHHERFRPLPVFRVKFSDPESTWFHIHAQTGELLGRLTFRNRVQRWLYNGMHTLDFSFLIDRRPLWDILLVLLCAATALFSLTAVVIAWKTLLRLPKSNSAAKQNPALVLRQ